MKALTPAALTRATGLFAYSALPFPRPTQYITRAAIPTPTTRSVRWSLYQSPQRHRSFKASPLSSRLATGSRRNRFVLLQTGSSPPVAPHAASRRRSYFRLQSHDSLWQGLSPCWQSVLTDALDGRDEARPW